LFYNQGEGDLYQQIRLYFSALFGVTNVGVIRNYARFALREKLFFEYIKPLPKFRLTALANSSVVKIRRSECGIVEAFIG
jgi:hypothetical protein